MAPMKNPTELMRNIDPAWPVEIFNSLLIVGSSGENINRLMKVRKKTRVRYRMLQNMDRKVSGTGQDLSDIKPPFCINFIKRLNINLSYNTGKID